MRRLPVLRLDHKPGTTRGSVGTLSAGAGGKAFQTAEGEVINGKYLRWILRHIDEINAIWNAYQVAIAEPTLRGRILAMHPVIDALAEIVEDFPPANGFGADEDANALEAAESEAVARNIDWARLLRIAEKLLPIVLLFLGQDD